jgi:uncharacterized protein (DUF58 family)
MAFIERRLGLTANGVIVIVCAIAGLTVGKLMTNRALLLLVYGVIAALGCAYGMGRRRLAVDARRSKLPSRVREEQLVEVDLALAARRGVSMIILEETLPEQFGHTVRVPVPHLPAGEETEHHYTFLPKLRGVYEVGPLTAVWSDPFGLTKHRMVLSEPTKMIVHPRVEQIHDRVICREWEDPPVRPPVPRPWPNGFEFYGMRDYAIGDDPRRIMWRATAKNLDLETGEGRYLVRESEQGITDRVTIILDTDASWHSPGHPSQTFETAVQAAASLSIRHLRDGFSLTLERNSDRLAAAYRGRRAEIPLLDRLAEVTPEKTSLDEPISRLLTSGRSNTHYVLITPHLTQKSAARIRLLMERGTSVLLVLVVWDGTDPLAVHRAGSLGCNVVDLKPGVAMDRAFLKVTGARR